MSTKIHAAIVAAALTTSACANTATSPSQTASLAGHHRVVCSRVAPTGSRIKTHVDCGNRGGYGNFEVRTWADIEKERD